GRSSPSICIPHALAIAVAHVSEIVARASGDEPAVPLEGARMARSTMFVDTSKARGELGFRAGSVPAALERAVRWYSERGYGRTKVLRHDSTGVARHDSTGVARHDSTGVARHNSSGVAQDLRHNT